MAAPLKFAYGQCHALTAALLQHATSGEALGLVIDREIIHSVYRVAHTDILIDAFGPEQGTGSRSAKAARYTRAHDEPYEWIGLSEAEVQRMISGDPSRSIRKAMALARYMLREADALPDAPCLRPLSMPAAVHEMSL